MTHDAEKVDLVAWAMYPKDIRGNYEKREDWPEYQRMARAALERLSAMPPQDVSVRGGNDLYYLRAISRRLDEFMSILPDDMGVTLGSQALYDERDWLDDFIYRNTQRTISQQPIHGENE